MTFLQPGRRITALSAPSTVRSRRPPLSADGRGRGLPSVSATRRCRRSKRVAEIAENAGIDGNEVLEGQPRDWQIASGNFCNGPWRVNPFEWADPIAGVLLLYGVGARAAA